jgi:hypothetical protein
MDIDYFIQSIRKLELYCVGENYKGWDPYDGLNSKFFHTIPLVGDSDLARLAWIQIFKRNPINLRKLFLVPKDYNPKGIGLLINGYCNIYNYQLLTRKELFTSSETILSKIRFLADLLLSLQSVGYSGACWGYNFDWQARRLFLFPKHTPTVVATTFCAIALFEAYEITKEKKYLETALYSSNFVLNDLKRTLKVKGFLFSYSPMEGNNTVYNASLLGTKLLSFCYRYSKDETFKNNARASAEACVAEQNADGSWYYGELPVQKWIDSFHTGYNLEALMAYQENAGDGSFKSAIEKGFDFYLNNFFLPDGTPKYYHNKTYPVDIHISAQLLVTLCRSGRLDEHLLLAEKVIDWTVKNMQDKKGYFYYQKTRFYTNRISYMRWSNAFMFNALSLYLLKSAK